MTFTILKMLTESSLENLPAKLHGELFAKESPEEQEEQGYVWGDGDVVGKHITATFESEDQTLSGEVVAVDHDVFLVLLDPESIDKSDGKKYFAMDTGWWNWQVTDKRKLKTGKSK